jgi:hypothetical protein
MIFSHFSPLSRSSCAQVICHLDGAELPYTFTGVAQLVEDFIAAVSARRAS